MLDAAARRALAGLSSQPAVLLAQECVTAKVASNVKAKLGSVEAVEVRRRSQAHARRA